MLGRLRNVFFSIAPFSTSSKVGIQNTGISPMTSSGAAPEVAIFANGCFWGTEHIILKHYPIKENKGVLKTSVGFMGGKEMDKTNYRDVCSGKTGHAEACRVEFDPSIVKYDELVEFFYRTHDPTTVNAQGNDHGTQYRSAIFTTTDDQARIAREVTAQVQKDHFDSKGKKIVTEISPATKWFEAEDYHQEYLINNPSGYHCPTHKLWW